MIDDPKCSTRKMPDDPRSSNNKLWIGIVVGVLVGLLIAGGTGVVVVNLIIPWEDVRAVLAASHVVVEAGSSLISQLIEWLDAADAYLVAAPAAESAPSEAATGLSGLLDQAKSVTSSVQETAVNLVTLPLRALIEIAQVVLSAVQESVDAAQRVIESVDAARC